MTQAIAPLSDVQTVTLELRGKTLTGEVTDADVIFFMFLFFFSPSERLALQRGDGIEAVYANIKQRQQEQLNAAIAAKCQELGVSVLSESNMQEVAKTVNGRLAEGIYYQLNNDGLVRNEAAQRFCEIFSDIDPRLISFDESVDTKGDRHRKGKIRLTSMEILSLVGAILKSAKFPESGKTPEIEKTPVEESVAETSVEVVNAAIPQMEQAIARIEAERIDVEREIAGLSPAARARLGIPA